MLFRSAGVGTDAPPSHFCPQCGQLTGVSTQSVVAPFARDFRAVGVLEVTAAAALATPALYPAFFFVPEKGSKSAENAVIPTFPMHWSHGLQHLRHKRPTFAFTSESGHTLGSRRKIAHSGSQGQTGQIENGLQHGQIVVHTVIQPTVCCFL